MKYLITIIVLFSLCSCYAKRQQQVALKNIQWANKQGAITDSIYTFKHK